MVSPSSGDQVTHLGPVLPPSPGRAGCVLIVKERIEGAWELGPALAGCRGPVPCVHTRRVRAALEESAAIHGNALGTDGRVQGWVPAAPSWWTPWSLQGAAAHAGGSRGLRHPLRVRRATRLESGVGGWCWGACGEDLPETLLCRRIWRRPKGASLEQGQGKKAVPGNSAFAGELKKGLSWLWFEDWTLGTWPELLRLQSEVSLPTSEETELLMMGCVFLIGHQRRSILLITVSLRKLQKC